MPQDVITCEECKQQFNDMENRVSLFDTGMCVDCVMAYRGADWHATHHVTFLGFSLAK